MFKFPQQAKLKQASDFRQIFRSGKKFNNNYFAVYSYPNSLIYSRLGLVIAKKSIRLAVDRNSVKRVIRESFRLKPKILTGLDILVLAYKDLNKLDKAEFRLQLERGWLKLLSYYEKS